MMGRGKEAVDTHLLSLDSASSKVDKARAFVQLADAQHMMGELDDSLTSLQLSLKTHPRHLDAYYPMVQIYKELGNLTKSDWSNLAQKIEKGVNKLQDKDAGSSSDEVVPNSAYWALFETYQKCDDLDKAWHFLNKAHLGELESRGKHVLAHLEPKKSYDSIVKVFQKGFWSDPSIGHPSRTPVFIVGMMRYVSCCWSILLLCI